MAKQSLETRLRRRKVQSRRGVWTTWQSPSSWESTLLRAPSDHSVLDLLARCSVVGGIEENITDEVLHNRWTPPGGSWALLITTRSTNWVHLASVWNFDSAIQALREEFPGEALQTGHQDTAGVTFVRTWKNKKQLLEFVTDGAPWDAEIVADEEEDEFDFTKFENTGFDSQFDERWLANCENAEAAHQQLIAHLDAYVPCYWVDFRTHELGAYHSDVVDDKYISRIDLIHFGPQGEPKKSNRHRAKPRATAALSEAIDSDDIAGVKAALDDGASLIKIPDGIVTPLAKACWRIELSKEYIVETLLNAGAEPDNGGFKAESPLEIVLSIGKALPATLHQVIRLLIEHGADVNAASTHRFANGARPLHQAASMGRLDYTILLLQAGADPTLADFEGRIPRTLCEKIYQEMKKQLGEESLRDQHFEYAAVCEALKQAESGTIPLMESAQPQIDALTAKAERRQALMRRFGNK